MIFTPEIVTLCHSAMEQDGVLSILGAFYRIIVPRLPHPFPPFTLACRLRFETVPPAPNDMHKLRVTVVDIDGRILGQMEVRLRLSPGSHRPPTTLNIVFPITGMELQHAGEHAIDLILDEEEPVRTPFQVEVKKN